MEANTLWATRAAAILSCTKQSLHHWESASEKFFDGHRSYTHSCQNHRSELASEKFFVSHRNYVHSCQNHHSELASEKFFAGHFAGHCTHHSELANENFLASLHSCWDFVLHTYLSKSSLRVSQWELLRWPSQLLRSCSTHTHLSKSSLRVSQWELLCWPSQLLRSCSRCTAVKISIEN